MSPVRLVSTTKPSKEFLEEHPFLKDTPEAIIAFTARVSSNNQDNPEYDKLLAYCIQNKHWSPFELTDLTVEILTSRAIAQQILRHRSFSFQEFSQRYQSVERLSYHSYNARRQDLKNRQNSLDDLPQDTKEWFEKIQLETFTNGFVLYQEALAKGIAKECARFLLPLNTGTRLYMKGSVRSWIHYLEVRTDPSTQKEHREIAEDIKMIFVKEFPTIARALKWTL